MDANGNRTCFFNSPLLHTHYTHDALGYHIPFLSPRLDEEQPANLSTIRLPWLNNVQQWVVSEKMACMSMAPLG